MSPPCFVALGDSLTLGVGDPVGGAWRGWAALLARGLAPEGAPVRFHNLAVSGARTDDVLGRQVPAALALRADLVAVLVGVNDTLRSGFDIHAVAGQLQRSCAAVTGQGAPLLTACLPDPGAMLGLPGALARPLARRQRAVNAVVHALAARHDGVHLHLADARWTADRTLWSADRLHPGERGHRLMAASFHDLLAARGLAAGPRPGTEPQSPPPGRAAALRWLAIQGTRWAARRCTDLLPELLALAAREIRHGARGTGAVPGALAERELRAALARCAGPLPAAPGARAAAPPLPPPEPAAARGGPRRAPVPAPAVLPARHAPGGQLRSAPAREALDGAADRAADRAPLPVPDPSGRAPRPVRP